MTVVAMFACSSSSDVGVEGNTNGVDIGANCAVPSDCKSGICENNSCAAPPDAPPTHADGRKNLDETDVDCGGSSAAKCASGKRCARASDCTSTSCVGGTCRDISPANGIKDGDETDVDCGGKKAKPCASGLSCNVSSDCESFVCGSHHKCAAPTASDGVKNGDESDIDCGGTTTGAPRCEVGKTCNMHTDCSSDGCSYKNICVAIRSCTAHHGGDTCGPGEADDTHESCCTTIAGSGLDKYNVTAGRFRQFVERTNGNLRGWAEDHAPDGWDASWNAYLPTVLDNGGNTPDDPPAFSGVYQELGPYVHGTSGSGNQGCFVGGPGARTYRLPDDINARVGDSQKYSQEVLDEKPMNCVTGYMMAAFCAWDRGRLPTAAEWNQAWGPSTYPWGATPEPAGWETPYDRETSALAHPTLPPDGDRKRANYGYNYWSPTSRIATDGSVYISAPGRFPDGNGPDGHADLAGNVFNILPLTPCADGWCNAWSKSGSWQGHTIGGAVGARTAAAKYWAAGGRCFR